MSNYKAKVTRVIFVVQHNTESSTEFTNRVNEIIENLPGEDHLVFPSASATGRMTVAINYRIANILNPRRSKK